MTLKDATELVTFVGHDDWSRALFETKSGILVVDVDGELHSICDPEGWAEPWYPLGYATPEIPHYDPDVWTDDAIWGKEQE